MSRHINFVLQAHMPWVKRAGRWPFGEEWLFEAMADCYVPLLETIAALERRGVRGAFTLGVTPVLLEMLRDSYLRDEFERYLDSREALAREDAQTFAGREPSRASLASLERERIVWVRRKWREAYARDLIEPLAHFASRGAIEILSGAATHAYLPLLGDHDCIEAQIDVGLRIVEDAVHVRPSGVWLPECAYHPRILPVLERAGLRFFYADARGLRGRVDTTLAAYGVQGSNVCCLIRDEAASGQVWDDDLGYPGDPWYREFHKRHHVSGLRYWRVSEGNELDEKAPYEAARAEERVSEHARDFLQKVLTRFASAPVRDPMLTLTFDAELFGHWWREGLSWLEATFPRLQNAGVACTLPSNYLAEFGTRNTVEVPESSWGVGGDHRVWWNEGTRWMWDGVYERERRFRELASGPHVSEFLEQAERELRLLESSDWAFHVTNGAASDYPVTRFEEHARRFDALCSAASGEPHDAAVVAAAFACDTLFCGAVGASVVQALP